MIDRLKILILAMQKIQITPSTEIIFKIPSSLRQTFNVSNLTIRPIAIRIVSTHARQLTIEPSNIILESFQQQTIAVNLQFSQDIKNSAAVKLRVYIYQYFDELTPQQIKAKMFKRIVNLNEKQQGKINEQEDCLENFTIKRQQQQVETELDHYDLRVKMVLDENITLIANKSQELNNSATQYFIRRVIPPLSGVQIQANQKLRDIEYPSKVFKNLMQFMQKMGNIKGVEKFNNQFIVEFQTIAENSDFVHRHSQTVIQSISHDFSHSRIVGCSDRCEFYQQWFQDQLYVYTIGRIVSYGKLLNTLPIMIILQQNDQKSNNQRKILKTNQKHQKKNKKAKQKPEIKQQSGIKTTIQQVKKSKTQDIINQQTDRPERNFSEPMPDLKQQQIGKNDFSSKEKQITQEVQLQNKTTSVINPKQNQIISDQNQEVSQNIKESSQEMVRMSEYIQTQDMRQQRYKDNIQIGHKKIEAKKRVNASFLQPAVVNVSDLTRQSFMVDPSKFSKHKGRRLNKSEQKSSKLNQFESSEQQNQNESNREWDQIQDYSKQMMMQRLNNVPKKNRQAQNFQFDLSSKFKPPKQQELDLGRPILNVKCFDRFLFILLCDSLLFLDLQDQSLATKASIKFEQIQKEDIKKFSPMEFVNNQLVFANDNYIYWINLRSKAVDWKYVQRKQIYALIAIPQLNLLVVGGRNFSKLSYLGKNTSRSNIKFYSCAVADKHEHLYTYDLPSNEGGIVQQLAYIETMPNKNRLLVVCTHNDWIYFLRIKSFDNIELYSQMDIRDIGIQRIKEIQWNPVCGLLCLEQLEGMHCLKRIKVKCQYQKVEIATESIKIPVGQYRRIRLSGGSLKRSKNEEQKHGQGKNEGWMVVTHLNRNEVYICNDDATRVKKLDIQQQGIKMKDLRGTMISLNKKWIIFYGQTVVKIKQWNPK